MFLGVLFTVALAAGAPTNAAADIAAPVIVPPGDSTGAANATSTPACYPDIPGNLDWRTCRLPERDAVVDWPSQLVEVWPGPRSFILSRPGLFATWLGETRTETGRPLIWYDIGSGYPRAPASGGYEFPLAGKYAWECLVCIGGERNKLQGTMYVIGPRVIVGYKLVSADNSGTSITYSIDASGSFVTDYTPHSIVEYSFDFQDDGIFDQTSPEPTAQATFAPGPHTLNIKVRDDTGRVATFPFFFEIPYVRPPNPEPNPAASNLGLGNINSGVKFPATKIKITAVKKIKIKVLRSKGLAIKVGGLTRGDRVKARLMYGKKTVVASGNGTATSSTKNLRLRTGKTGKRILKRKKPPKRLVIDVAVEGGSDGFTTTKRVAVRTS